ncbi:hypothetical protein H7J86_26085 [Mycobacterium hackensackense]|uniref:hypothetical protein n=1 Tax=Mycobacterium hackensackense TaxID=228909 RepID=UPI002265D022|nr:hypothetical protein [Mycobacterium hackensackense]MCV7255638.1 hypothetical protein [Mycobacterium hackensackense]
MKCMMCGQPAGLTKDGRYQVHSTARIRGRRNYCPMSGEPVPELSLDINRVKEVIAC